MHTAPPGPLDTGSAPKLCRVVEQKIHDPPHDRTATRHSCSCGIASQIVRRQLRHSDASGGFLHDVPNRLYRHPISPCPSYFVDPAKQPSSINCGCGEPIVQFCSDPIGNWNRSNVASLADQINNGPMLFTLLEMIQCQSDGFMPSQPTRE